MPLTLNIRHLEQRDLRFSGAIPPEELNLAGLDELISPQGPLYYDFDAARQEEGILLQGSLELTLRCECARCLKAFPLRMRMEHWAVLLPWEGEGKVLIRNDCVDLTPYLREDMVLALPQRPLCEPGCGGLADKPSASCGGAGGAVSSSESASAWAKLDDLKL